MPFKSEKQRTFLKINHPDIYKRWKKKYGPEVRALADRMKKKGR